MVQVCSSIFSIFQYYDVLCYIMLVYVSIIQFMIVYVCLCDPMKKDEERLPGGTGTYPGDRLVVLSQ